MFFLCKSDFFLQKCFGVEIFYYICNDLKFIYKLINESMENLLTQIKAQIEIFDVNAEAQCTKGVKAAGARARKAALEISKLMKEFRKVSLESSK